MLKVAYHHIFVFLITSIVEVAAMLSSDDGFSLLNCVKPDGSLDVKRALECLNDVEDEHRIDDVSLFSCVNAEGGLDVAKFVQMQEDSSLLELSIFMEAGLIDNSGTPTGATIIDADRVQTYIPRRPRSSLYEVWDGGTKRQAVAKDSYWWKMYIEHPMLNVPKFHRCFRRRFRLPYAMFIQFVSDAKENNWFPRWSHWNSTCQIELLILGGFRYLGRGIYEGLLSFLLRIL